MMGGVVGRGGMVGGEERRARGKRMVEEERVAGGGREGGYLVREGEGKEEKGRRGGMRGG
jgi:hypothetical protein